MRCQCNFSGKIHSMTDSFTGYSPCIVRIMTLHYHVTTAMLNWAEEWNPATPSGVARMEMLCGHNMGPRLNFSGQFFSYCMLARGMGRMPLKILQCLSLIILAY